MPKRRNRSTRIASTTEMLAETNKLPQWLEEGMKKRAEIIDSMLGNIFPGGLPRTGEDVQSIAGKLGSQNMVGALGGIQGTFGGFTRAAGSFLNPNQSAPSAIGGTLGGLGDAATAVGGPLGWTAGGVLKLGEVAFKAVDKMHEWSDSLHTANMKFADFSSAMAEVSAKTQAREIDRAQRQGEERGKSAEFLAEQRQDAKDQWAPIEDKWAKTTNYIAGAYNFWEKTSLKRLNEMVDAITGGAWTGKKDEEPATIDGAEWMAKADEFADKKAMSRRPERMR